MHGNDLSALLLMVGLGGSIVGCTDPEAGRKAQHNGETGGVVDSGDGDAPWRSSLYPDDWVPGYATADGQLRDFSTAGYRAGDAAIPVSDLSHALSILDHGADPTGESDSTPALQAVLDAAAERDGPVVVHLPTGRYRIDGVVVIDRSELVVQGDGSTLTELWFTASEGLDYSANLTFRGAPAAEHTAPLVADTELETDRVVVAAGSGFAVGDEVWLGITITDDFAAEHQMEDYWAFSRGQWRPFFRRTVIDVVSAEEDQEALVLDVTLPYPLTMRDDARIERIDGYLEEVGLVGVGLANATDWEEAWAHDQIHAVAFDGVRDGFVQDVRSFEPPDGNGHHLQSSGLLIRNSRRFTVADAHLAHSQNRGEGGNGYLFEVRVSNAVLVRDSTAQAGRHNFIQNWDFGTSDLVFLRTHSEGAEAFSSRSDSRGSAACSETHHALAIAVLVDQSTVSDCWKMVNRLSWSSGAGHTATESVFWNLQGTGTLTSHQFGRGYIVGTDLTDVATEVLDVYESIWTAPEDFTEGLGQAATLEPASLYEDQRARRAAR